MRQGSRTNEENAGSGTAAPAAAEGVCGSPRPPCRSGAVVRPGAQLPSRGLPPAKVSGSVGMEERGWRFSRPRGESHGCGHCVREAEGECVALGGKQDGVGARTGLERLGGQQGHGPRRPRDVWRSRFGPHAFRGLQPQWAWAGAGADPDGEGGAPCQAPRTGAGDKERGGWWPSWRVLARRILGLVLWKERSRSMILSRDVARSK